MAWLLSFPVGAHLSSLKIWVFCIYPTFPIGLILIDKRSTNFVGLRYSSRYLDQIYALSLHIFNQTTMQLPDTGVAAIAIIFTIHKF